MAKSLENRNNMQLSDLKETYPTTNDDVLNRFLNDVSNDTSVPLQGLDMKYPQELLSDNMFMDVITSAEFYETGYADAMHTAYIDEHIFQFDWGPEDFEDYNKKSPEEKMLVRQKFDEEHYALIQELKIINQMPDFYQKVVNDYINAFKNENPAFKDVEIPFSHPPMPDYFPDVTHNGKSIEAECLGHETVKATQFCLMKDPTDKKSPYFVMAYKIDKIDDVASYKVQNLNTRNITEARSMFVDVVAGRPPKGLSIQNKLNAAIHKSAEHKPQKPILPHIEKKAMSL